MKVWLILTYLKKRCVVTVYEALPQDKRGSIFHDYLVLHLDGEGGFGLFIKQEILRINFKVELMKLHRDFISK